MWAKVGLKSVPGCLLTSNRLTQSLLFLKWSRGEGGVEVIDVRASRTAPSLNFRLEPQHPTSHPSLHQLGRNRYAKFTNSCNFKGYALALLLGQPCGQNLPGRMSWAFSQINHVFSTYVKFTMPHGNSFLKTLCYLQLPIWPRALGDCAIEVQTMSCHLQTLSETLLSCQNADENPISRADLARYPTNFMRSQLYAIEIVPFLAVLRLPIGFGPYSRVENVAHARCSRGTTPCIGMCVTDLRSSSRASRKLCRAEVCRGVQPSHASGHQRYREDIGGLELT